MSPETSMLTNVSEVPAACWSRIGVQGDRSCPTLAQAVHCRNCHVFAAAGQQLFERESPPDYVEQWTRQLAEIPAPTAAETLSLLVFRIGGEWLALDANSLVEVVEPRRIHRVPPRTDPLFLGLTNIRGELQLCISLRELMGIEPEETGGGHEPAPASAPRERLLVAEREQTRWVFPVDEVEGVHRVPADAMENLPHTLERSPKFYCQAAFSHHGEQVGLLSQTRLFEALARAIR
jgi:chemotaxis-related protein WspD